MINVLKRLEYVPLSQVGTMGVEMADYYDNCGQGDAAPITRFWLLGLWEWARINWLVNVCAVRGHDYECTAFSGEDGYEQITCNRCGISHNCWH